MSQDTEQLSRGSQASTKTILVVVTAGFKGY